jgi:hypothetical protein
MEPLLFIAHDNELLYLEETLKANRAAGGGLDDLAKRWRALLQLVEWGCF